MHYTEHTLSLTASAKIYQEIEPTGDGYYQVTQEDVLRRNHARGDVECTCGETFSTVRDAKEHVERVEWIQTEWDVDPLTVGEEYVNPDDESQSIIVHDKRHNRGHQYDEWVLEIEFDGLKDDKQIEVPEKPFTEAVRNRTW